MWVEDGALDIELIDFAAQILDGCPRKLETFLNFREFERGGPGEALRRFRCRERLRLSRGRLIKYMLTFGCHLRIALSFRSRYGLALL